MGAREMKMTDECSILVQSINRLKREFNAKSTFAESRISIRRHSIRNRARMKWGNHCESIGRDNSNSLDHKQHSDGGHLIKDGRA